MDKEPLEVDRGTATGRVERKGFVDSVRDSVQLQVEYREVEPDGIYR